MMPGDGQEVTAYNIGRVMRASFFLLGFVMVSVFTFSVVAAQSTPLKKKDIVIYKKEGVYAAFPQIFLTPEKNIVLTFNAQSSHLGFTGDSKMYVSKDGATWTETKETRVNPTFKFNNGYYIPKAVGWKTVSREEGLLKQKEGYEVKFTGDGKAIYTEGKPYVAYSKDGKSWVMKDISLPKFKLLMGYNYSAYLRLGDNALVSVLYGKTMSDKADRPFVLFTNDGGEHWDFSPMFDNSSENFNETAVALNTSGDVIALMRDAADYNGTGSLYLSLKKKGEKAWTEPLKTNIVGTSPNLITLADGRMIATYAYRRPPMGIRTCVSLDGGKSWDLKNEYVLRSDAVVKMIGDVGYPMTIELGNGNLLTVYYITLRDGMTHIAATLWQL